MFLSNQVMTGGQDEYAKRSLNLSDCIEFCQVGVFSPHNHLLFLIKCQIILFIEILLMQNFGGITGLSFPASALAALDQPTLCTCHTRAKEVRPFFLQLFLNFEPHSQI